MIVLESESDKQLSLADYILFNQVVAFKTTPLLFKRVVAELLSLKSRYRNKVLRR